MEAIEKAELISNLIQKKRLLETDLSLLKNEGYKLSFTLGSISTRHFHSDEIRIIATDAAIMRLEDELVAIVRKINHLVGEPGIKGKSFDSL